MITSKLEKEVILYKSQFDKMTSEMFGGYILDRISLDLDALIFRIKYMHKHNKDLTNLPDLKEDFQNKSIQLRDMFNEFLFSFLVKIVNIPDNIIDNPIKDIFAHDVKIDANNVKFTMVLISDNTVYLEYVNSAIKDNEVFNMFPNEYFRYQTDSYNDAIAKTYPELFENKHIDGVGTGADGDVFVHNFTFQTTERCSLNCTYCFGAGTKIMMADYTYKNIEDVDVGDEVIGCYENRTDYNTFFSNRVTNVFHHKSKFYIMRYYGDDKYFETFVTGDHKVLMADGIWKTIKELYSDNKNKNNVIQGAKFIVNDNKYKVKWNEYKHIIPIYINQGNYEIFYSDRNDEIDVYNLETECHTYIANNIVAHNCYQANKSPMRMEFETAKRFIDNLLADKYGYINRYNSPAIIIEFIGGEPLLEINLTRKIYEYFLDQCYELNHPWFSLHRLSICSNGLSYFDEEVQSFFKDYGNNISFNISIDGNKELHDSCRVQPNGEGSYDVDMIALDHYTKNYVSERNSKMTLAPSNIRYLSKSVIDFINHGMTSININCVFEEGWDQETARMEYNQLTELADYILENNLENIYIAIFNERQEDRQDKSFDGTSCGGSGSMLAMRPNGEFYPCIRYMPTSLDGKDTSICIGNVHDGLVGRNEGSEILKKMDANTRRSQTNDICYECPISNDCPDCSGLGYAVFGSLSKKTGFICIQMIAEALANVYYWNLLNIKHPEYDLGVRKNNVPDEWSLIVIDKSELELLKAIESRSMITTIDRMNMVDGEDE